MSKESAHLSYEKPKDEVKYVTHKFEHKTRTKKAKVPSYENKSEYYCIHKESK